MSENKYEHKNEFHKFLIASLVPAFFMFLCWMVFLLEISLHIDLSQYGLLPRSISNWYGIFTMPFLHGGFDHILSNTVSFIIMGTMIFYFYKKDALSVFLWSYFLSGILTWIIGRDNIHIGASAMIYAFAGYIFTSGILSKNRNLTAVSLIVVFLYGSMIWGIFPQNNGISWEGHLSGLAVGIGLSFIYRPPKFVDIYEDDDDEIVYTEFKVEDYNCTESDDTELKYFYKEEKKNIKKSEK
ncbi:MAG: rhomboid family intramembrane serine protease [Bacteroidales bacterium]|jgi:membrane associated rhomboid family serine protease|nr:rhomboid family intramembrane serine protease [Bacteroidales bacterium]